MSLPCELVPVTFLSERPGSGTISFSKSGIAGTRKWVVPWVDASGADYVDRVTQLLGMTIAGPSGLPAITYPDVFSAEFPWLFCQEVDVEGEDCVGFDKWGRIAYRRAVLTAKYMPYEMGESFSLSSQALSLKESTFSYLGTFNIPQPPAYFAVGGNPAVEPANVTAARNRLGDLYDQLNSATAADDPNQENLDKIAEAINDDQQIIQNWLQRQAAANASPYGTPDPAWVQAYQNWQAQANTYMTSPGVGDSYFQAHKNGTVGQAMIKITPLGEYSLDRQQVLSPNFWTFISLLGSVNAYFFLGFPPWTLLFSGVEGKRSVRPNGTRTWDLTFKFHFNPNTWNMIYRSETGRYEIVATNITSTMDYWSWQAASKGQPSEITQERGPLHGWLYRPMDFSPVLLFS
jgi:hypothetical protein